MNINVIAINESLGIEGPEFIELEDTIWDDEKLIYDPEEVKKRETEYMREYNKKYYHENPEKVKEWRNNRIEQRRKSYSDWYRRNREKVLEYKREQYRKKKAKK